MLSSKPILYAEDNENDVMLVQVALKKAAPGVSIQIVSDGYEAVSYMKGEGKYSDRTTFPEPHFLLLDLKMPKMTGMEVLEWVRSQPNYKHVPVVMLTASLEKRDQERCYGSGANSFLVKPNNLDQLTTLTGLIANYWLQWNRSTHIDPVRGQVQS